MSRSSIRLAAVVAAGLLLAACGGAADTAGEASTTSAPPDADEAQGDATGGGMDDGMDDGMDMSGAYGAPADASEADRTIEVAVDNDLAFKPDEYEVAAGEVVTFRITNTGDIEHEFVLGDEQAQQQMAEEMAEADGHAHSAEMSNAVTIRPGEEAELIWRFPDEATTVLVGCHVPGHWEAGMRGSVTVG
jgi:uncharacterized cupredoxin-like copper-binding protein